MPILEDEDEIAAFRPPVANCDMCGAKMRRGCIREVRVELEIAEEYGGGSAPDIVMVEPETGRSMLFCSPPCAKRAAEIVANEVQNPTKGEDGTYCFPNHIQFRKKIEKWDIHYTKIGPASYDKAQASDGGV